MYPTFIPDANPTVIVIKNIANILWSSGRNESIIRPKAGHQVPFYNIIH